SVIKRLAKKVRKDRNDINSKHGVICDFRFQSFDLKTILSILPNPVFQEAEIENRKSKFLQFQQTFRRSDPNQFPGNVDLEADVLGHRNQKLAILFASDHQNLDSTRTHQLANLADGLSLSRLYATARQFPFVKPIR